MCGAQCVLVPSVWKSVSSSVLQASAEVQKFAALGSVLYPEEGVLGIPSQSLHTRQSIVLLAVDVYSFNTAMKSRKRANPGVKDCSAGWLLRSPQHCAA